MAMFYDWRDRTGKEGLKPFRQQLRELRSPLFIRLGIFLLVVVLIELGIFLLIRHVWSLISVR